MGDAGRNPRHLATDNLLENTDGVRRLPPHQRSLGTAACYLLFMLTRATLTLMSSLFHRPGTGANYSSWIRYIYSMQNLTFGAEGGLAEACRDKHPDDPHVCFMAPHMADTIKR